MFFFETTKFYDKKMQKRNILQLKPYKNRLSAKYTVTL